MSQPLKGSIEVEITSCLYFLIDRYFCPSFDSLSKNKDSCKSNEGASVKEGRKTIKIVAIIVGNEIE